MRTTAFRPSALLLTSLQAGINRLLAFDTGARSALAQLAGKVIAIEITQPPYQVFLLPGSDYLELTAARPGHVDVSIRGRPAALLGMVIGKQDARSQGHVEIRGDIHLAQRFQQIMQALDVDWEEFISMYAGDMAAHHIGRLGRDAGRYFMTARQSLITQFTEYLRYEQNMLPLRHEIDHFIEAVDGLRDDVERVQQRLQQLEQQRGGQS